MNVGNITTSWQTSLFGAGGIGYCLFDIISNIVGGTPEKANWAVDVPVIINGVGLLFAKDSNVTGGTKVQ